VSATCTRRRATGRSTRWTRRCAGAIGATYPHLRDIKLVNYKVRILDEWKATGAVTRVLLDASDGTDSWGAIGVHENVIEASWDALVDSLEAGMLPGRLQHARPTGDPSRVSAS
jgi:2-isopropylmalate synthase